MRVIIWLILYLLGLPCFSQGEKELRQKVREDISQTLIIRIDQSIALSPLNKVDWKSPGINIGNIQLSPKPKKIVGYINVGKRPLEVVSKNGIPDAQLLLFSENVWWVWQESKPYNSHGEKLTLHELPKKTSVPIYIKANYLTGGQNELTAKLVIYDIEGNKLSSNIFNVYLPSETYDLFLRMKNNNELMVSSSPLN